MDLDRQVLVTVPKHNIGLRTLMWIKGNGNVRCSFPYHPSTITIVSPHTCIFIVSGARRVRGHYVHALARCATIPAHAGQSVLECLRLA